MKKKLITLLLTTLLPASAGAQGGPPPGYFAGTYEMVGRSPGASGKPLADWLRIEAEEDHLQLKSCRHGNGRLAMTPSEREGAAPLVGSLGDWSLSCHFTNDGNNYPRLTCYATDDDREQVPGLLTLWPAGWERPDHAADCP